MFKQSKIGLEMKTIFLIFLLMSPKLWAAELSVGASEKEDFTATITNPRELSLQNLRSGKTETIKFKNSSISDISKLHLTAVKNKSSVNLEMLLVVLSVFDKEQSVQIYVPVRKEALEIQQQKMNPVCQFSNQGDFSWDQPSQLEQKIRLSEQDGKTHFQIAISHLDKSGAPVNNWKTCFSF